MALITKLLTTTIKKYIPFFIIFELTYRCNLHCQHCYIVNKNRKELGTYEIKDILDQLKNEGTFILTLTGGEIFLRDDIFEIIQYAKLKQFILKIYTNATLLHQKEIKLLKKLNPYDIHISVYGTTSKIHDAITQVEGSFKKTIETIKKLKKEGLKIKLKCPLMKQNIKNYKKIIKLANDLNVEYLLDPIITPKHNGNSENLSLRIEEKDIKLILKDPQLKIKNKEFSVIDDETKKVFSNLLCNAGYNSCAISPYGDVFPCIQYLIKLGNLRKNSFHNIWKSKKIKKIRSIKFDNLLQCSKCELLKFCNRCPGLAYLEDKNLFGKSSIACKFANIRKKLDD